MRRKEKYLVPGKLYTTNDNCKWDLYFSTEKEYKMILTNTILMFIYTEKLELDTSYIRHYFIKENCLGYIFALETLLMSDYMSILK